MSFTTQLHNAAREGNVAEVTRLLSQGASVVIKDKHSRTPLHLAAWAGQLECCKVLVAQGTDKNAAAMDDTTALHFAAQKGHFEVARFLLNEGVSINGKTRKGMTPLMFAAQSGNVELVKLLIKRKADPASKNKNGKAAAELAREPAMKELLEEAAVAALKEKAIARPDANTAQPALASEAPTPADELNSSVASAAVEIGPQERPDASVHQHVDDNAADASKPPIPQASKKVKHGNMPEEPHNSDSDRPSKLQKVALSFAEDDDDAQ